MHNTYSYCQIVLRMIRKITRRPTNWWGSAKRDITHPTAVPLRRVRFLAKGYEHPSVVSFPMIWHNWTKRPIDYESQFPKQ